MLGTILCAVGAFLLWRGLAFYRLPLEDRVDSPDFQLLRPSGLVGNGLGYAGALLVTLNLLYLVRRRQLFSFGSMRTWLDLHVMLAFDDDFGTLYWEDGRSGATDADGNRLNDGSIYSIPAGPPTQPSARRASDSYATAHIEGTLK